MPLFYVEGTYFARWHDHIAAINEQDARLIIRNRIRQGYDFRPLLDAGDAVVEQSCVTEVKYAAFKQQAEEPHSKQQAEEPVAACAEKRYRDAAAAYEELAQTLDHAASVCEPEQVADFEQRAEELRSQAYVFRCSAAEAQREQGRAELREQHRDTAAAVSPFRLDRAAIERGMSAMGQGAASLDRKAVLQEAAELLCKLSREAADAMVNPTCTYAESREQLLRARHLREAAQLVGDLV